MELKLQQCNVEDLEQLTKISKETFISAFEKDNDPNDFKTYIDEAFSKERLLSELENKGTLFYFVLLGHDLIGYLKLNSGEAQTDINDNESLELERIYVVRQHQGKGIGDWLLEQVKQIAFEQKLNYVWLGVWERTEVPSGFMKNMASVSSEPIPIISEKTSRPIG